MPDKRAYAIRKADAGDVRQLHELIAQHAAFERDEASLSIAELGALLGAEELAVTILVAAAGRDLLGYAALTIDFSLWRARRWAHLDCLFVHERHRGSAIGSALLARARRVAHEAGADRLEGQTPQWNGRGIAFYEREGAAIANKARFRFDLPACASSRSPAGSSRASNPWATR